MTPRQQAQTILGLAIDITNAGTAQVFADYFANINKLEVNIYPANQKWDKGAQQTITYRAYLYLDDDTAHKQMASIIDALKAIQAGQQTLEVAA